MVNLVQNTGSAMSAKQATLASKMMSGGILSSHETTIDKKPNYSAMMNKTRIDNLPPLQELSMYEQSFESHKKQMNMRTETLNKQQSKNQSLRSRSKNYRNFETSSYIHGTHNSKNLKTSKIPENDDSVIQERSVESKRDIYISENPDDLNPVQQNLDPKKRDPRSREMLIDNSISVISSIANPNKEILIKTGHNVIGQGYNQFSSRSTTENRQEAENAKSNNTVNSSKLGLKTKAKKKYTVGNSMLKVNGTAIPKNPKYGQIKPSDPSFQVQPSQFKKKWKDIIRKGNAPMLIGSLPKTSKKKNSIRKQFIPGIRVD